MQTRTYGDLFALITNMIGAVELAADEQTQVKNFINRRYFEAYQSSPIWPRYVISGEARTISPDQIIKYAEDSFLISAAGKSEVNGLYQYGPEYSGHNSYVLNGDTLSFDVTAENLSNPNILGTYKLDASYSISGNTYNRGVWVNQTNGNLAFARYSHGGTEQWRLIRLGGITETTVTSSTFFPWQNTWADGIVIQNAPSVAYNIERNDSNNHWELMQQDLDGTATVLYKDANGNIPSETVWEILNAPNPTPIVHDLDTVNEFIRVHKSRSFFNNSAMEYDFYVDSSGAHLMNVVPSETSIAYVTYKKTFTKFDVTSDYYNSAAEVPEEFFNFIAHSVYADFLRVQNKQEEAIAEETIARNYLNQELEKADMAMSNVSILRRINTHTSRQSR